MASQRDLIWSKDWDVLMVLDACRYDVFELVYNNLLKSNETFSGTLLKTISSDSVTSARSVSVQGVNEYGK